MMDADRAALLRELEAVLEATRAVGDVRRSVPRLIVDVCATLRRFGQETLATQYATAFDRWQAATETVASSAAFSDEANPAAVAAKDDASGEFLRLTAEIFDLTREGVRGVDPPIGERGGAS